MARLSFLYKMLTILAVVYVLLWLLKTLHIGFIQQLTPSMPEGWYFTYPQLDYHKGDSVVFIPNQQTENYILARKWLPKGIPLLKEIVGVAGDSLCIKNQNVYINGQWIGKVYKTDGQGNILPMFRFCGTIPKDSYFMQGVANPHSFDSRYYGLVNKAQIMSKAVKL
ncbi:signal peptidase I [Cysteiniphilum halobium]|uniref:signal peptidase I n=1 Tax=Cysteiniphilum halobium TaxID=2219059 RepID=UPI0013C31839|nr:signal peptidase I [Cysteiniphilum halobium]